jgi:hypothetical protein
MRFHATFAIRTLETQETHGWRRLPRIHGRAAERLSELTLHAAQGNNNWRCLI